MSDDNVNEVEITAKGIVVRGEPYSDIRPLIRRGVAIAEDVLQVLQNVVGLPADVLNHYLGTFRQKYRERLESIPVENRQPPDFRIGCGVLKEVAYAADEPDLQKMFAELLATASDDRSAEEAHPAFANIINQLTATDAKILRLITKPIEPNYPRRIIELWSLRHSFRELQLELVETSLDNLVRLGLAEWLIKGVSDHDLFRLKTELSQSSSVFGNPTQKDAQREIVRLKNSLSNAANSMQRMLSDVGERTSLRATTFGVKFANACMPIDNTDWTATDESFVPESSGTEAGL